MAIRSGQELHKKDKELIAPKALVHSRTIVEKQDYVTTGISTYVEGELLGIDLNEYKRFELGDSVQLTFYSPMGIHRLQSTIIGKDEGSIAVIFPPRAFQFVEKRESPRVEVAATGILRLPREGQKVKAAPKITDLIAPANAGLVSDDLLAELDELFHDAGVELDEWEGTSIRIRNISNSGIGFLIEQPAVPLMTGENVEVELRIDGQRVIRCALSIVRSQTTPEGKYYGARFEGMEEKEQRALRAYILREQVSMFYTNRRLQLKKNNKTSRSDS
ncbi:PilZ domain-containing protein [Paenibacillus cellulosilyticus]|uniref:PilZ domain-containing protein n=1 Tax=Paenibacillus cellulosilyticus TaxID=375489 RepID=A0A2V2YL82_9BACL|nr:PilZ domain-containing protein [Paenibacillus cellulosilyticus]PWV94237.1 PilZ domain-containing protein [Paenibacillus cellulosilyticus]QKS44270.1 PilZ domain-containing protein [Paenibacillus cellulosilyticus]